MFIQSLYILTLTKLKLIISLEISQKVMQLTHPYFDLYMFNSFYNNVHNIQCFGSQKEKENHGIMFFYIMIFFNFADGLFSTKGTLITK